MSYVIVDNNAGRGVPPCHFPEFRWDNGTPFHHRPEEYDGAGDVKLCCTQHVHATEYQQKKLTDVWVDVLSAEPLEAGPALYPDASADF